jgi:hypothetical protein
MNYVRVARPPGAIRKLSFGIDKTSPLRRILSPRLSKPEERNDLLLRYEYCFSGDFAGDTPHSQAGVQTFILLNRVAVLATPRVGVYNFCGRLHLILEAGELSHGGTEFHSHS